MQSQTPSPEKLQKIAERRIPTRFNLRSLFRWMTVFAACCAFLVITPLAVSQFLIGAFWLVVTGWLVTGIVFAKGDHRAFCIGAGLVASSMWTGLGGQFMHGVHQLLPSSLDQFFLMWIDLAVIAGAAAANGWCCIWARRFFEGS